jgi:ABC-type antimicrobial peptide transport system permease subunit
MLYDTTLAGQGDLKQMLNFLLWSLNDSLPASMSYCVCIIVNSVIIYCKLWMNSLIHEEQFADKIIQMNEVQKGKH